MEVKVGNGESGAGTAILRILERESIVGEVVVAMR